MLDLSTKLIVFDTLVRQIIKAPDAKRRQKPDEDRFSYCLTKVAKFKIPFDDSFDILSISNRDFFGLNCVRNVIKCRHGRSQVVVRGGGKGSTK